MNSSSIIFSLWALVMSVNATTQVQTTTRVFTYEHDRNMLVCVDCDHPIKIYQYYMCQRNARDHNDVVDGVPNGNVADPNFKVLNHICSNSIEEDFNVTLTLYPKDYDLSLKDLIDKQFGNHAYEQEYMYDVAQDGFDRRYGESTSAEDLYRDPLPRRRMITHCAAYGKYKCEDIYTGRFYTDGAQLDLIPRNDVAAIYSDMREKGGPETWNYHYLAQQMLFNYTFSVDTFGGHVPTILGLIAAAKGYTIGLAEESHGHTRYTVNFHAVENGDIFVSDYGNMRYVATISVRLIQSYNDKIDGTSTIIDEDWVLPAIGIQNRRYDDITNWQVVYDNYVKYDSYQLTTIWHDTLGNSPLTFKYEREDVNCLQSLLLLGSNFDARVEKQMLNTAYLRMVTPRLHKFNHIAQAYADLVFAQVAIVKGIPDHTERKLEQAYYTPIYVSWQGIQSYKDATRYHMIEYDIDYGMSSMHYMTLFPNNIYSLEDVRKTYLIAGGSSHDMYADEINNIEE